MQVKVASLNDVKDNSVMKVVANGEEIALGKANGKLFAVSNLCPHKQGPMSDGFLDGSELTCPWHGWKFNVETGSNAVAALPGLRTFPVTIKDDDVFIEI